MLNSLLHESYEHFSSENAKIVIFQALDFEYLLLNEKLSFSITTLHAISTDFESKKKTVKIP